MGLLEVVGWQVPPAWAVLEQLCTSRNINTFCSNKKIFLLLVRTHPTLCAGVRGELKEKEEETIYTMRRSRATGEGRLEQNTPTRLASDLMGGVEELATTTTAAAAIAASAASAASAA